MNLWIKDLETEKLFLEIFGATDAIQIPPRYERIGHLIDGRDRWWKSDEPDGPKEMVDAVVKYGLPWFDTVRTLEDQAAKCDSSAPEASKRRQAPRAWRRFALAAPCWAGPMDAQGLALFDTAISRCVLIWGPAGVIGFVPPEGDEDHTRARLARRFPDALEGAAPPEPAQTLAAVTAQPASCTNWPRFPSTCPPRPCSTAASAPPPPGPLSRPRPWPVRTPDHAPFAAWLGGLVPTAWTGRVTGAPGRPQPPWGRFAGGRRMRRLSRGGARWGAG